jgi:tRNA (adenine58-N1)-methyltransferase non-catalytic subunit
MLGVSNFVTLTPQAFVDCTLIVYRVISLPKCGSFPSNLILDRPFNLTYELLDRQEGQSHSELRIVPATELHADTVAEEEVAASGVYDERVIIGGDGVEFELVGENGEVVMRSNRETVDDSARQTLTMEEIEALKKGGAGAGKDLIAKLMLSHTAIDQKTAFSLAKYKLLKTKKYLRQFTILPMDVPMLTHWLMEEKDPGRILEIREEMLALAGCWGNVHFMGNQDVSDVGISCGRWLAVDEVGGLLVAAMAERMGILYQSDGNNEDEENTPELTTSELSNGHQPVTTPTDDFQVCLASTNTITLIHSNAQPNLSLLKYFNFNTDCPSSRHPLTTHLKFLSWLQLLSPDSDTTYSTHPPSASPNEIASWKSGKRGTYYRKRRRWARTTAIVNETRRGNFSGLLIASSMDPVSILRPCIPLLCGGAPVAIYSPTIEPLAHLADLYSTSRRTAFITKPPADGDLSDWAGSEDFPLNPTLLLGVSVQTSKVRRWQALPGRTHPLMTGRGGAEGYLFTATKVLPIEGKVEARGKFKRRKTGADAEGEVG